LALGTVVRIEQDMLAPDSVFVGWGGACSGTGPCEVTMDGPRQVVATFRGPQTLTVDIASLGAGAGNVLVVPLLANCANAPGAAVQCSFALAAGTTVTLTATPDPESVFVGWGGVCSGDGPCEVLLADDMTVQATFRTANRPPVGAASGPASAARNQPVRFDGSGSTDPDGDPLTYTWTFGDGATGSGPTPEHAYAALGSYAVTLVVSDGIVSSAPATIAIAIVNQAPVANGGGPYAGFRGQAVQFDGTASTDPDGDPLSHAWDFGDGATASGPSPTHVYESLGTFAVTLVVTDGLGGTASWTTTATIANAPPIPNAGPDRTVRQRSIVLLDGRGSRDADGTIVSYAWRQISGPPEVVWGSGNAVAWFRAPRAAHGPVHLVFELTVTDDSGATATDPVTVTVTQ
jgi:PKD repeat protein